MAEIPPSRRDIWGWPLQRPPPYTLTHIHIHHRCDQLEIMLDIKIRSVGDGLECQVEQKTGGTGEAIGVFST